MRRFFLGWLLLGYFLIFRKSVKFGVLDDFFTTASNEPPNSEVLKLSLVRCTRSALFYLRHNLLYLKRMVFRYYSGYSLCLLRWTRNEEFFSFSSRHLQITSAPLLKLESLCIKVLVIPYKVIQITSAPLLKLESLCMEWLTLWFHFSQTKIPSKLNITRHFTTRISSIIFGFHTSVIFHTK